MMLRSRGTRSKPRQRSNEESNSRKLPSRAGVHIFILVTLVLCSLTIYASMLRSFNNVAIAYKKDEESSNIEGASISSVANYESHTKTQEKEQLEAFANPWQQQHNYHTHW